MTRITPTASRRNVAVRATGAITAVDRTRLLIYAFTLNGLFGLGLWCFAPARDVVGPSLALCSGAAVVVAVAIAASRRELPSLACEALALLGSLLLAGAVAGIDPSSTGGTAVQAFVGSSYVGVAVFAAIFFPPLRGAVQLAFAGAAYWGGLVLSGRGGVSATAFTVLQTGEALAIGLAVAWLVHAVRWLSSSDDLTGLGNREFFRLRGEEALASARRSGRSVALLLVDLDGFKAINDTHGHHAGDAVLQAVAQRLRGAFRTDDVVARWGGDEFVILLTDLPDPAAAQAAGEKVVSTLGRPVTLDDGSLVPVGASVGASIGPRDGLGFEDHVRLADAAMYADKQSRRSAVPAPRRVTLAPGRDLHGTRNS